VLELSHIAGPVIALQADDRIFRNAAYVLAKLFRKHRDEMPSKRRDVFLALFEFRQLNGDLAESIVEIIPEVTAVDLSLDVAI